MKRRKSNGKDIAVSEIGFKKISQPLRFGTEITVQMISSKIFLVTF